MEDEEVLTDLLSPTEPAQAQPSSSMRKTRPLSRWNPNPLPWNQLSVVLFVRSCDALAGLSVGPYINQLVGELEVVGGDKRKVGYYVGVIDSFYQATLTLTVLPWNRLSDHIGRRPVMLIGIFGSMLSMLSFGLSRTFWTLIISRSIWGLLDGNIGIIKSIVGEITDSTNRARGFAVMSVLWSIGASIGPVIGGKLERPADHFSSFKHDFWIRYPYFLPNLTVSIIIGISFFVALLFFKETVTKKSHSARNGIQSLPEERSFLPSSLSAPPSNPLPLRQVLVRPVIIAISNYTSLAFLGTCHRSLFSLFAAMPVAFGGLGFDPERIGYIMGLCNVVAAVFMATSFARLVALLGERRAFLWSMSSVFIAWVMFPLINICARNWGVGRAVWGGLVIMGLQVVFWDMAYGCVYVFITSAAPNKRSLGSTNGISQTSAAIARTIAPAMATSLYSFSVEHNLLGGYAVYVVMFALTCGGMWLAMQLPRNVRPAWEVDGEDLDLDDSSIYMDGDDGDDANSRGMDEAVELDMLGPPPGTHRYYHLKDHEES